MYKEDHQVNLRVPFGPQQVALIPQKGTWEEPLRHQQDTQEESNNVKLYGFPGLKFKLQMQPQAVPVSYIYISKGYFP